MNVKLGDVLQHYGVKGMKWGVRRYQPYPKGSKNKGRFIGDRVRSKKRELSTLNKARNRKLDRKTTADIKKQSRRQHLENELKRLSRRRSSVGTRKDRRQYRRRDKMSDRELRRKVDRLLAKEEYKRLAIDANRDIYDIGKKIITKVSQVAIPATAGYMLTKYDLSGAIASGLEKAKNVKIKPKDIDRMLNTILK